MIPRSAFAACVLVTCAVSVPCEDKSNDCARITSCGPNCLSCDQHPEYMRRMCAQTCGVCADLGPSLEVQRAQLNDTTVVLLSAKGVRRWCFVELPVLRQQADCTSPSTCPAEPGVGTVMVTHAIAAHYYDSRSHFLNSSVFRWRAGAFVEHQMVPTVGAWDLVAFEIEGTFYLVVASLFDGGQRTLPSAVHRWDVEASEFVPHQEIWMEGAMDVEAFVSAGNYFIVITGHRGAPGAAAECKVLRWAGAAFVVFQTLAISGGHDAEAFSTGSGTTLVVVHEERVDVHRAGEAALQPGGAGFKLAQTIEVAHSRDAAHFWQGSELFLALAVFRDDASYETESRVFAWDAGSEQFREAQRFPSSGGIDVEVIEAHGNRSQLVAVASQRSGTTHLYTWDNGLVEAGSLDTARVYDVSWHQVREDSTYVMGVARFGE